jgi:hypothetical protein
MCYCIFRGLIDNKDYKTITLEEFYEKSKDKDGTIKYTYHFGDEEYLYMIFNRAAEVEDKDLEKCLMEVVNSDVFKNNTTDFIINQFWGTCSTCMRLVYSRKKDELAFNFINTALDIIEKNYSDIPIDKIFPCSFGSKYIKKLKDFMFCIVFDWIMYWTDSQKDKETYDEYFKETLDKPFVKMVLEADKEGWIKNAWNTYPNHQANFYTEFPTF